MTTFRAPENDNERRRIAEAIRDDDPRFELPTPDYQICRYCGEPGDVEDPRVVEFHDAERRCDECGAPLEGDLAEVYLTPEYVEANGLPKLAGMMSDNELQGPFLVHAEPCYLANAADRGENAAAAKYLLA